MSRSPAPGGRPLSLPVLYILLSLVDGRRHGYGIKLDVERRSGGSVVLGPGTLYEGLQRLESEGLVAPVEGPAGPPARGPRAQRRYYRLTRAGRTTLREETDRLGRLVDAVRTHTALGTAR